MTLEEFFTIFIPQFIVFLIIIIVFLLICWFFLLFLFSPPKDVLSQAFAEIFTQEQQDYIKANYKQVIVGKKTIDELTDETLKIRTED